MTKLKETKVKKVVKNIVKKNLKKTSSTKRFFEDLPDENIPDQDEIKPISADFVKPLPKLTKKAGVISNGKASKKIKCIDEQLSFSIEEIVKSISKNDPFQVKGVENRIFKEDELKFRVEDVHKKEVKQKRVQELDRLKRQKEIDEQIFEDMPLLDTDITFKEMNLSAPVMKALETNNYEIPTPIQASTVRLALQGRDICGCAATGTGKTIAFMLPVIERLSHKPKEEPPVTRVLVLVPTRELGVQVYDVAQMLSAYTDIKIVLSVGGLDIKAQKDEIKEKPDIIIATPGRLIAHTYDIKNFSLDDIEILILDEADRILDENFSDQLKEIVRQCSSEHQTLLFSATMTNEVKELALVSLNKPVRVFVNQNTEVARNLRQEFIRLRNPNDRLAVLCYLVKHVFTEKAMVFVSRKYECHFLHIVFALMGLKCGELHGDKRQVERLNALDGFRNGEFGILIATDVAARGLDIQGVQSVINYKMPNTYKQYVHRVGRTARAGEEGCSVSIYCTTGEDYTIQRAIRRHSLTPLHERIVDKENIKYYAKILKKKEPLIEKVKKRYTFLLQKDKSKQNAKKWKERAAENGNVNNENTNNNDWFKKQEEKRNKIKEEKELKKSKKDMKYEEDNYLSELTSIDEKSVKMFRKGPSYKEKEEFKNKFNTNKKKKKKKNRVA